MTSSPAMVSITENDTEITLTASPLPPRDDLTANVFILDDLTNMTNASIYVPDGCNKAVGNLVPLDNPDNVMSTETLRVVEVVIYCGLIPLLCLTGLVTNPCSCVVFCRLGVKKGINLCLVLLSLSDTLFLVTKTTFRSSKVILTLLYGSEGASRWGRTMVTYHILRKTEIFLFFSNFITTLASVERCASIISPLKARLVFSHSRIVTIVAVAFVGEVFIFVVIGFKNHVHCIFNVNENTAVWGITASEMYTNNKLIFDIIENPILIFGFPLVSVTVMVVCTSLIFHRLRQAARWRQHTSSSGTAEGGGGGAEVSKSETQVYKMLAAVACMHVACTVPTIVRDTCRLLIPAFEIYGNYGNLFNAVLAITDTLGSINCTVNFFIYYKLSVQFRHTLATCLGRQTSSKTDTTVSAVFTTTSTVTAAISTITTNRT